MTHSAKARNTHTHTYGHKNTGILIDFIIIQPSGVLTIIIECWVLFAMGLMICGSASLMTDTRNILPKFCYTFCLGSGRMLLYKRKSAERCILSIYISKQLLFESALNTERQLVGPFINNVTNCFTLLRR